MMKIALVVFLLVVLVHDSVAQQCYLSDWDINVYGVDETCCEDTNFLWDDFGYDSGWDDYYECVFNGLEDCDEDSTTCTLDFDISSCRDEKSDFEDQCGDAGGDLVSADVKIECEAYGETYTVNLDNVVDCFPSSCSGDDKEEVYAGTFGDWDDNCRVSVSLDGSDGLGAGAIAGIVIGVLAAIGIAIGVGVCCCMMQKKRRESDGGNAANEEPVVVATPQGPAKPAEGTEVEDPSTIVTHTTKTEERLPDGGLKTVVTTYYKDGSAEVATTIEEPDQKVLTPAVAAAEPEIAVGPEEEEYDC